MTILIAVACGVLVFLMFVFFIEYTRRSRNALRQRMRYYADGTYARNAASEAEQQKQSGEKAMDFVKRTAKYLAKIKQSETLDLKMQQAGLPILGSEFLVMAAAGGVLAGIVVFLLTMKLSTAVIVAFAALIGEWCYILYRIDKRRNDFVNQLSDCLTTVANALRAGFSFLQAMELISREMEPPVSEEFEQTIREMKLGTRMEEALETMDVRVGCPDFSLVITAVLIQHQVGGNLAQILDTISSTINERIRMRREVMALTAQGRASGWVLALLPVVLAAILTIMNPTYLAPLWEDPLGRLAIGAALVMELIGFLVIKRIVDVEV